MVLVAVAGGTSPTLGRSTVTAIFEAGKHEVVILSRTPPGQQSSSPTQTKYNAPIRYVDYDSIDSITTALQGVHTLITVLKVNDPTATVTYHSNLLHACVAAKVSRFAPADFSLGPLSHAQVDLLANKSTVWKMSEDIGIRNGIECASFENGMFMNYFAQGKTFPNTRDGQKRGEEALNGLEDDLMLEYIDIANGKLVIPLDDNGNPSKFTMTLIADIGKFMAAAVDLPKAQWHGFMGMVGEICTMAEVAEIINQKTFAHVQHEIITSQQCDERIRVFDQQLSKEFSIAALKGKMVAQMMKLTCEGKPRGSVLEPKLNELCPDVKPLGVEEYLIRTWGAK